MDQQNNIKTLFMDCINHTKTLLKYTYNYEDVYIRKFNFYNHTIKGIYLIVNFISFSENTLNTYNLGFSGVDFSKYNIPIKPFLDFNGKVGLYT